MSPSVPFFRLSTNSFRQGSSVIDLTTGPNLSFMKKPTGTTPNSRREFARKITAGIAGAGLLGAASSAQGATASAAKPRKNLQLHAGADYHVVMADPSMGWNEKQKYWTTKRNFEYHERCGVRHFYRTRRHRRPVASRCDVRNFPRLQKRWITPPVVPADSTTTTAAVS